MLFHAVYCTCYNIQLFQTLKLDLLIVLGLGVLCILWVSKLDGILFCYKLRQSSGKGFTEYWCFEIGRRAVRGSMICCVAPVNLSHLSFCLSLWPLLKYRPHLKYLFHNYEILATASSFGISLQAYVVKFSKLLALVCRSLLEIWCQFTVHGF